MRSSAEVLEPYLKEKGYTFPVLSIVNAADVENAVNDNGIPQNWVLDRGGASVWRQIGYMPESYDEFSKKYTDADGGCGGEPIATSVALLVLRLRARPGLIQVVASVHRTSLLLRPPSDQTPRRRRRRGSHTRSLLAI